MKKIVTALSIVLISLSFSYESFTAINNASNNVYASRKHHKTNSADENIWQKIYDALNVQE